MTRAERYLCEWQYNHLRKYRRTFYDDLFNLMSRADKDNIERISEGFPEEVRVFKRYKTEPGYWEKLNEIFEPKLI